jgi:hypothetical protein
VLRRKLLRELEQRNPGAALTLLQRESERTPGIARHCAALAAALGRAAVRVYGRARAQSFARPVCDTSFATGVAGR